MSLLGRARRFWGLHVKERPKTRRLCCPGHRQRERRASPRPYGRARRPPRRLPTLDARVKVILLLAATIAVFASGAPWALAVWLLCALAVARLSGMHAGATLHSLKPMLVLFAIVVAVNFISLDGTAEVMVAAPFGFSPGRARRAPPRAIARIVALVLLALSVSASTTPTQLADAFVRLMSPLATVGVPVGDIGLTLSMALRFIPLVSSEAERIRRAQAARGVDFESGGVMRRVRAWAFVITPLVVGLFRRADRIAQSMDARCFEPEVRRARPRAVAAHDACVLVAGDMRYGGARRGIAGLVATSI